MNFEVQKYFKSRIFETKNIEFKPSYEVSEIYGEDIVTGAKLLNKKTGEEEELSLRILLDRYTVEIFADGGAEVFSACSIRKRSQTGFSLKAMAKRSWM